MHGGETKGRVPKTARGVRGPEGMLSAQATEDTVLKPQRYDASHTLCARYNLASKSD